MFDSIFPKHWTTLQRLMWLKTNALARAVYEIVTGNPVTFTAKSAPLRQLKVAFSPVQDLHGYDSPWPAGGGVNKWDEEWLVGYISNADGVIHESSGQTRIVSKNKIPVQPSTEYYIAGTASVTVYGYAEDESYVSSITVSARKFTTPANVYYICFETSSAYGNTYNHDIAINYPSSVTSYAPYSNECPISGWDSVTVEQRGKNLFSGEKLANASISASGTLENNNSNDVLIARVFEGETYTFSLNPSGVTVGGLFTDYPTMDSVTYNNARLYLSGSESYTYTIPQGVKYIGVRYLKTFTEYQIVLGNSLPAEYTPYNPSSRSISISLGQTVYGGTVDVLTGVVKAMPYFASYNGETLVGPWMSSMDKYVAGATPTVGAQVVDMGGTETTIQLTPQEVQSLAGDNVLFSDANGDLTVEYRSN